MLLQIRTDTFYAIEMTEQQIQELSIVFEGLLELDIDNAVNRVKEVTISGMSSIHETVQTFRRAIAEHNNVSGG